MKNIIHNSNTNQPGIDEKHHPQFAFSRLLVWRCDLSWALQLFVSNYLHRSSLWNILVACHSAQSTQKMLNLKKKFQITALFLKVSQLVLCTSQNVYELFIWLHHTKFQFQLNSFWSIRTSSRVVRTKIFWFIKKNIL